MSVILKVQQLQFQYTAANSFKGLRDVHFELEKGKVMAIIGESGCGKSTLLRCINGFHDLNLGTIHVNDERILGPAYNLVPGYKQIQYVSQDALLLENHTVEENVSDKLNGYVDAYKTKTTKHLLRMLQLTGLEKQKPKFLSSGQRQRLSIARALAAEPSLYLLDEPFTNLDYPTKRAIWKYLSQKVSKQQIAVLLVTHLPDDVWEMADEVMVMKEGKIVQKGRVEKVYYQPKDIYTTRILGESSYISKKDLPMSFLKQEQKEKVLIRPQHVRFTDKSKSSVSAEIIEVWKTNIGVRKYLLAYKSYELIAYSQQSFNIGEHVDIDFENIS
jgi:iron(III) transport system ATP-binding protein